MVGKFKTRTNEEWRKWITISDSNDTEKTLGIKGNCEISRLEYVHLNLVAPPEYMHAQLIDTVKLIIDAWLGNVVNVPKILSSNALTIINSK